MRALVTGFRTSAGTRLPDVALNLTRVPMAPGGDRKPSETASLSVKSTSVARSELGSRPALSEGRALERPSRGSETSAPEGGVEGLVTPIGGVAAKVPFMPISPHAALTCGRPASVSSVPWLKAGVAASATG